MKKIMGLEGRVQHYLWGGQKFIPQLLGIEDRANQYAEYWLGAHAKGPALVETNTGKIPLDAFLESGPRTYIGEETFKKFGRLPYLFKVLDVNQMLSIQVHPSKREAEKGFAIENELGIPLDAPNRNYRDDNHKPEIMAALGEFWLLHGFLERKKLLQVLNEHPEFEELAPKFLDHGYKGLYQYVMEMPAKESDDMLRPLVDRILPLYKQHKLSKSSPDYWVAKAVTDAGTALTLDKGIFSIYFFNLIKVNKGDAVFQDAGVPHAYLEGQTMELMANSDNVLRGGLTQKHMDVKELLKHIVFEETIPKILKGSVGANGIERKYITSAPDFQLSELCLDQSKSFTGRSDSVEIYILMEGEVTVYEEKDSLTFNKGDSFLILAGAQFELSTSTKAVLFKASMPQQR